jgi:metallo-beta-lactamase class B
MKYLHSSFACAMSCAAIAIAISVQASAADGSTPPAARQHLQEARRIVAEGHALMYGPLIMCYPEQNRSTQAILKIPPPTRVFDNLYFVGMGTVSAWVVKTGEGSILIDTLDNPDEAQQYILGGMVKLGLDPSDIKYIVISHGHGDHYGGARFLQDKLPAAKVVMSAADYELAEQAAQEPRGSGVPAPRRGIVATDGQKLKLGDTTLSLYITPGHSPATLSMLLTVKDHGVPHTLSMWGGSASNFLTAELHAQYDKSIRRFRAIARDAKVDGIFATHPPLDDSANKIELMAEDPKRPNPYLIGADEVDINYRLFEECNLYHAALQSQ